MLVSLQDTGLTRLSSARHEFPTEWFAFLNAADGTDEVLMLNLTRGTFRPVRRRERLDFLDLSGVRLQAGLQ